MLAEAEVQGMKLQMVNIQAKPNKQVMMMMMMGNTMMKMVFDGEKGSLSQQGMNNPLPDDQVQDMIMFLIWIFHILLITQVLVR